MFFMENTLYCTFRTSQYNVFAEKGLTFGPKINFIGLDNPFFQETRFMITISESTF